MCFLEICSEAGRHGCRTSMGWGHLSKPARPQKTNWSFSGAKYGWSLRLKRKKRVVLYLIPQLEAFLVGVVLGDRALSLLRRGDLNPEVLSLIDEAPRYGEGTGFRIPVASAGDIADIEVIIEAKMS